MSKSETQCERAHAYQIIGEHGAAIGFMRTTPGQALVQWVAAGPARRGMTAEHLNGSACLAEEQHMAALIAELAAKVASGGAR